MKKNIKISLIVLGIIVLIGIIFGIFYATGVLQSAISVQELTCSKTGTNEWTCGNYKGSSSSGASGKISFRITKPSAVSEWNSLYFETAKDISVNLKDFLNTHTNLGFPWGQPANSLGIYTPYDKENNWAVKLPGMGVEQYYENFGWDMKTSVAPNIIKTQFVVIEGNYNDRCPTGTSTNHSTNVKTYGLCNGRDCWVYDLFPNTEYQLWSNPGTAGSTCGLLEVSSIKIYSKDQGYTEEEGKLEYGFIILDKDIIVYRLENNQCINYVIKQSTKLTSDFDTLESCKLKIIETPTPSDGGGKPCIENWNCNEFSPCLNNQQTRTCNDLNNCGTVTSKPSLIQSCNIIPPITPCKESWVYSEYSNCINGQMTRTATDKNSCGTTIKRETLSKNCQIVDNFWNQKTLGIKNIYLIIGLISLVIIFVIIFIILISLGRKR